MLLMSVMMHCEAPDHPCSDLAGPAAKLNQMGQCTCYLKKSGGPPTILPVLQKEGCIWQYGPSDRNHRISVATSEQLGSQLNLCFFSSAKNLEACALFSAMGLAQKIGSPIGTPKISKFSAFDIFISSGKPLRPSLLNNSHLEVLIKRPSGGPSCLIMLSACKAACLDQQ